MFGASFNTPEENKEFADSEGFPYPLLCDVTGEVGAAYGTKRPDHHPAAMVPRRLTFLIDPEGNVRKLYVVKDVMGHASQVLYDLKELGVG